MFNGQLCFRRYPLVSTLFWCLPMVSCDSSTSLTGDLEQFPATPLVHGAITEAGRYTVDLYTAPEQPPTAGAVAIQLRIGRTEQQSANEELEVDMAPVMPSMGHGTAEVPTAVSKGSDRYVFSRVDLFMAGRWDLVTKLSGAEGDDTITIPIDVR